MSATSGPLVRFVSPKSPPMRLGMITERHFNVPGVPPRGTAKLLERMRAEPANRSRKPGEAPGLSPEIRGFRHGGAMKTGTGTTRG